MPWVIKVMKEVLMIAAQAYGVGGAPGLEIDEELNDFAAVGSAVDVVSQKNELCRAVLRESATLVKKLDQFVEAPVNVADREK